MELLIVGIVLVLLVMVGLLILRRPQRPPEGPEPGLGGGAQSEDFGADPVGQPTSDDELDGQ